MFTDSVFQAEVWAIKKASELILEQLENPPSPENTWISEGREVTIYSDSQATLKALKAIEVKSKLVFETIQALNKVACRVSTLSLRWVRGHSGHGGNINADIAARFGRDGHVSCHPDAPEIPKAVLHQKVDQAATDMWKKVWNREPGCSQTRLWFPDGPRRDFSFDIIRLPKVICSQITQFVTGHCFLNRHQALIENEERARYIMSLPVNEREEGEEIIPVSPALCRRCGLGEEKPSHLMSICPELATTRLRIFAHPFPPHLIQISSYIRSLLS